MASADIQNPTGHSTSFEPLIATVEPGYIPHDVKTTLNYYKDPGDGSAPAPSYVGKLETYERPVAPFDVVVKDVRGKEKNYTLDSHGFQFVKRPSAETEAGFVDDEHIKAVYYPEVEQLIKDTTGATRVYIFDHTIRRQPKDSRSAATTNPADPATPAPLSLRGPVQRVHIDQSYSAARSRVPHHLPEEADKLLETRHQIINIWRPIRKILKDPLAVADAHSVPDSDLVPVGLIYPDRKGETYTVKPNVKHQWYYLYGQDVDEVTFIKCYDSKLDGRARRIPHTAFVNPEHVDDYSRESIEVRTLVFYENEPAE